jgi:hypothetical protein
MDYSAECTRGAMQLITLIAMVTAHPLLLTPVRQQVGERVTTDHKSVIFRKVTGCFRSHWGARLYAAAAYVIPTGWLNGKSALQAIQDAIAAPPAAVIP